MRLFAIIFLSLILTMVPASAEVQYIEGYSLDGISKVTPTAGEVAAGVLHKFENNEVIVYVGEDSIRFTAKTDSGNAWVQYDFNNPSSVQPSINASEKSATWTGIYSNVDVKYTLIPGGLKQEIIVYDIPQATKFRELITVSDGLTLEKQNGEWTFFKDGIRVFSLQKPYAVDANETEFNLDLTKSIEGTSMYLEIDASEALQECVFPLVIDPTTYSGGYLSFWGVDIYDLPTLYSVTNNSSYISYDAPNVTYTFHVPVYQNANSHVMSMDNATILLKSNNDGAPAYIKTSGHTDFSDLNVFGWDTVALDYAPNTDTTRAYMSCISSSGDTTNCNFSYLGYSSASAYGFRLYQHVGTIDNLTTNDGLISLQIVASTDVIVKNSNISGKYGCVIQFSDGIIINDTKIIGGLGYGIKIDQANNCTLNNVNSSSDASYGIQLNIADFNTLIDCIGISGSSRGIYVYLGSDWNNFINLTSSSLGASYGSDVVSSSDNTFINGSSTSPTSFGVEIANATNTLFQNYNISGGNYGVVISSNSNNTDIINSSVTSTSGKAIRLNAGHNVTLDTLDTSALTNNYSITGASDNCIILNSVDDSYSVEMGDETSQLTIENTDGQLFNETATATAYSYQNGTFQMYETGTAETFTITQYDSFLDSTTANSTVLGVPHATSSINVTSGTLNSWISSGLTPSAYYELLGGTTLGYIYADTGGNVTVSDDLTTGVYYLTPAVTYNVSGYVFDDSTPATAIEGATVNRAGVQSTTTNASGYYLLAVYNSTSTFTASANGYNYNQTDITVDGAPLTNQNFTLTAEQPNNVPLPIYLLTSIVTLGGLFLTIPRRDDYGDEDVTLRNVIAGIISGGLAVTLSKVSINGQLVQTYAGVASTDVVVTGNSTIQIAYLGWFWIMIAIVAFMMTFYCVLKIVQYYADSELDMDFGDEYI